MNVKSIEWSYPTSENAVRFGHANTGCWTVEEGELGKPYKAVAAFLDKQEAIAHADTLPGQYCPLYLKYRA